MPAHPFTLLRAALCCAGLVALHAAGHASETHEPEAKPAAAKKLDKAEAKPEAKADAKPEAKAEGKPETKAEAKAEPKPEARAEASRKRPATIDPMDKLRERLAEKLGASKPVDKENPNLVRVAAHAPEPAAHEPQPAARLAAAYRQSKPAAAPAFVAGSQPEVIHIPHWGYAGQDGPDGWASLRPEFATCSSGTRQSPIDIRDGIKVQLDPVQFDYKPSGFRVIDNGHTVQVNVGSGNSIEVLGRRYDLVQFHFHRPSEERVNGKQFDMVVHLVHKDIDGRLAVVAVLLDRGAAQPLIQAVWNNLPLEKGDEVAARGAIDMNALLPADRSYYTYMGSLTTPPCSEGVLWMVMKNPVPISADQIGIFARLYPMNARPIQSASGRLIKESN